ncbi:hypothetical protein Tco_1394287 [Tanacetum coccineum]
MFNEGAYGCILAGCYNYGIKAGFLPVEPRFGEGVVIFCLRVHFSPIAYSLSLLKSLPELFVSSHGGTMTMSLMHQWHDTICGGVISPRRSLLYGAYGCILEQGVTIMVSEPGFSLTKDQAANSSGTVSGTLFLYGRAVFVLFDAGATYFVSDHEYQNCPLHFDDKIRFANLLPLELSDFDFIFSMNFGEGVVIFCLRVHFSPIAYSLSLLKSLPELFVSSHGGTMTMSLMHQWHDTICGGVISPRRSLLERMDAS